MASRQVMCWGADEVGQIGDGRRDLTTRPALVPDLDDAVEVAPGFYTTCARKATGRVECWGDDQRALNGSDSYDAPPSPIVRWAVDGLNDAVQIGVGNGFGCAVRANGRVFCWGFNRSGEFADEVFDRYRAGDVVGIADALQVAPAPSGACARTVGGEVACWGFTEGGRHVRIWRPVALPNIANLEIDDERECVRRTDGSRICWSDDVDPWLGFEHGSKQEIRVFDLNLGCGLRFNGDLDCAFGEVPDEDQPSRHPMKKGIDSEQPRFLSNVRSVVAGRQHACALMADGRVLCWGRNRFGQLGRPRDPSVDDGLNARVYLDPTPVEW